MKKNRIYSLSFLLLIVINLWMFVFAGWTDFTEFENFTGFGGSLDGPEAPAIPSNSGNSWVPDSSYQPPSSGSVSIKSEKTYQYSIFTNEKYPIFIDTGIPHTEGEPLNPKDFREVVRQIAVRTNAKFVSDGNRYMIFKDDTLIIIDGSSETLEETAQDFEQMGISLKVQESRGGEKYVVSDYLETQKELTFTIDDKKLSFLIEPEFQTSGDLLPILSVGAGLGAEVTWDEATQIATITKTNLIIRIKASDGIALVNGSQHNIGTLEEMSKDAQKLLYLLNLVVKAMDAEMSWNATNGILAIRTG